MCHGQNKKDYAGAKIADEEYSYKYILSERRLKNKMPEGTILGYWLPERTVKHCRPVDRLSGYIVVSRLWSVTLHSHLAVLLLKNSQVLKNLFSVKIPTLSRILGLPYFTLSWYFLRNFMSSLSF